MLHVGAAESADWPMWGQNIERNHTTEMVLSETLHLQWVRDFPTPRRAWPWQMDDFEKLAFDASYEPVVTGNLVFISSMVNDGVKAYDIDTGAEKWRFSTDGPVRMAPIVWENRVYAASDDGHLYCLDALTGELLWKFRVAPSNRLVLGNERLISMWPVRGGPVINDGTLYFAAGIWPHEGVFIYSIDAATGEKLWVNSDSASDLFIDSKRYYSFGGVAPQGQLVISDDYLLVPGGRTTPAVYDRHSGEFLYLRLPTHSTTKGAGGHRVFTHGEWFFNQRDNMVTHMYALVDGAQHSGLHISIAAGDAFYGVDPQSEQLIVYSSEVEQIAEDVPQPVPVGQQQFLERGRLGADSRAPEIRGRLQRGSLSSYYELPILSSKHIEGLNRLHIKAGSVLFGSGAEGQVYAIDANRTGETPQVIWKKSVSGEVFSMVAAQGRLLVMTKEGRLYSFGSEQQEPVVHSYRPQPLPGGDDEWSGQVEELLKSSEQMAGYALMFGIGSGRMLEELLIQSDLHIVAFDPDMEQVNRLREKFRSAGLYGKRVAVHQGDAMSRRFPEYIASLIVSEDPVAGGLESGQDFVKALFRPLRPYGGTVYLEMQESRRSWYRPFATNHQKFFADAVESAELEKAELSLNRDHVLLRRPGSLPGSGSWTHQYSDAGNTAFSPDNRVKAPLGITWFGGPPNHKALPRHMNGPIPQVIDGRIIILGPHHISARCVYTGRELWSKELPFVGEYFTQLDEDGEETGYPNQPGANFIGSPYVSSSDAIYLLHDDSCLLLKPSTGELIKTFDMPEWDELMQLERDPFMVEMVKSYGAQLQNGEQLRWGVIRHSGDWLIAAAYPHMFDDAQPGREGNWNATSSEFIVVMNRHTGEIQWAHQARYGFRHNAIAAGSDKVFVIDNLSEEIQNLLGRRGIEPDTDPQVRALDIHSGSVVWEYDEEVFGTSLSYSEQHDVLVQSGHIGRRRALPDEPRDRILTLQGASGNLLWADSYPQRRSPLGLHASRREIIGSTTERAVDMLTGERKTHLHPITSENEAWTWLGALRCGTQNYSEHLISFRSGSAGITDLEHNAGTGNITGFRAGCTNNLIVADGMFSAPEYTRSCSCSYQLQTSLGLVHMSEAEWWTFNHLSDPVPGTIQNIGINFGAPGSRLAKEENVMWLEYPKIGGPAPDVPVEIEINGTLDLFRQHISLIQEVNNGHRWVAASGIEGIRRIQLDGLYRGSSNPGDDATYTVRLHFSEPADTKISKRLFDIAVQGNPVINNLDIADEAGGSHRVFVVEIPDVRPDANGALVVEFTSNNQSEHRPVISGMDVRLNE